MGLGSGFTSIALSITENQHQNWKSIVLLFIIIPEIQDCWLI